MVAINPWPTQAGALLLRDPRAADIDQLVEVRNDPVVNQFMVRTRVEPETFREELLGARSSDEDFACVAELEGNVVALGFLELVDGAGQPGAPTRTEALVGYVVDPVASGRGVGTQLAQGLVTAAFESLGARRVTAGCYADNLASVRILEKIGMRREQHGVRDTWHADLGWVDGYQYALLNDEWRESRRSGAPT